MMRVAVVTPYYKERIEWLHEMHQSVMRQDYPCTHIMVADGFPCSKVDSWNVDHIVLPCPHGDIGSTPRYVGCVHAISLGFDAIAFLDADNWYRKDHIRLLTEVVVNSGAGFASSGRVLCRLDGSEMSICKNTNPNKFIDTSCMMFLRPAFNLLSTWIFMPSYGHLVGDRIVLQTVRQSGVVTVHSGQPTVYYRCSKAGIYKSLNQPVPEGVGEMPDYKKSFTQWVADGNQALI